MCLHGSLVSWRWSIEKTSNTEGLHFVYEENPVPWGSPKLSQLHFYDSSHLNHSNTQFNGYVYVPTYACGADTCCLLLILQAKLLTNSAFLILFAETYAAWKEEEEAELLIHTKGLRSRAISRILRAYLKLFFDTNCLPERCRTKKGGGNCGLFYFILHHHR